MQSAPLRFEVLYTRGHLDLYYYEESGTIGLRGFNSTPAVIASGDIGKPDQCLAAKTLLHLEENEPYTVYIIGLPDKHPACKSTMHIKLMDWVLRGLALPPVVRGIFVKRRLRRFILVNAFAIDESVPQSDVHMYLTYLAEATMELARHQMSAVIFRFASSSFQDIQSLALVLEDCFRKKDEFFDWHEVIIEDSAYKYLVAAPNTASRGELESVLPLLSRSLLTKMPF